MLKKDLESVQDIVVEKQKKKKNSKKTSKPTIKPKEEVIPRITLLDAVDLIVEIEGSDYFTILFDSLLSKDFQYKRRWEHFLLSINSDNSDLNAPQIKAVFCLLIYVANKSLPIYGNKTDSRLHIPSLYLLSMSSWKDNFKEVKTDFKTYQEVTVEVKDIMYLF